MNLLDPRVRWWSRDRLVVVALVVHVLAFVLDVSHAAATPPPGLPTLLVDLMLVVAFAALAPRLGGLHVVGETRPAFLRDVWYRHWAGDQGLARRAWPRQTPRDEDRARDAMYRALSTLEGVRLQDRAGTWALAIALVSSAPGLALVRPEAASLDIPFWSAFVPAVLVFLLEPVLDARAGAELIDRGAVDRVTSLTPRRPEDLGIPSRMLRGLALLPAMITVGVGLFRPERLAGSVGLLLYCWGAVGLSYWILRSLPFLHFPGPTELSALLDVHYRARRIWALLGTIVSVLLVWRGMAWADEIPFLAQMSMAGTIATLLSWRLSCRYLGPDADRALEAAHRIMERWSPPRFPGAGGRRPGAG